MFIFQQIRPLFLLETFNGSLLPSDSLHILLSAAFKVLTHVWHMLNACFLPTNPLSTFHPSHTQLLIVPQKCPLLSCQYLPNCLGMVKETLNRFFSYRTSVHLQESNSVDSIRNQEIQVQ